MWNSLRKKCPYSELFWSTFSRIRTEYGEIVYYLYVLNPNTRKCGLDNSEYGHFLRSNFQDIIFYMNMGI